MIKDLLVEAIQNRSPVMLTYKGDFGERTFHPYFVYISTTGKTLVSGWQVSNPAKPLDGEKYHKFDVSLIQNVSITDESFQVKDGVPLTIPVDCKSLICGINRF